MNRRWRRVESRSVVGVFPATNLSLTVIFPEKALVKGQFAIHIFEDDMWLYNLIVSVFVVTVMAAILFALFCICFINCIKCWLHRLERDPPTWLEKWVDPIPRDYAQLTRRKTITEQPFAVNRQLFGQVACVICMEDFVEGEVISSLGCEHIFHIDCIKNWVDKRTLKSQLCPVCNQDIRKPANKKKPAETNRLMQRLGPVSTETDDLQPREDRAEAELVATSFAAEDSVAHLNAG